MTQTETRESTAGVEAVQQQTVHFAFYKLTPEWWRLSLGDRNSIASEFNALIDQWRERLILVSYTLSGIRADCDLMLWKAASEVDEIHELGLEISRSRMGPYLQPAYAYLSLTKRSIYIREHEHPGEPGDRSKVKPVGARYLFVYPFVKTREWYGLPLEQRQAMMNEHIRMGHKYPRVKLNTTYSFGLDDQEFVLAFETDYPTDFLDLVMELREAETSRYTLRDTPIFTCIKVEGETLLHALGADGNG
jgi:chlorite dismutase